MDPIGCGVWRVPRSPHVKDHFHKSRKKGGALWPLQKEIVIVSTQLLCGAVTHNHSGVPEFIPVFSGVCVAQSLVFCVMFCSIVI